MTQTVDLSRLPEKNGTLDLPDPNELHADDEGPDVLPPDTVAHPSDLDRIREDLSVELEEETNIPVATRPRYLVRCSTNITGDELDTWRKLAKSKKHSDGIDGVKLVALVLANKTTAILRDGEILRDGHDEALTFRHRDLMDLVKRNPREQLTAAETVQRFFGRDSAVDSAARALLVEAGWGEDVIAQQDPTVAD